MLISLAFLLVIPAEAAEIGSNDVARAIGNWRHRRGTLGTKLGEKVRDIRRVEANGVAFHVVRFEGGGHVIAPADTTVRPVVMFSGGDDFDANPANPALALIVAELKAAGSTDEPAMANDADIDAGAKKYIKTTVDLGLAKAITDDSVVKIGEYLVTNGEMSFIVKVDDVVVAKETVKNLVEVRATMKEGDWTKPSDSEIDFKNGKVIVTPNKGGAGGFARIKIPVDE